MTDNATDLKARLEFALRAAREAGRITLQYFATAGLSIDRKHDGSEVTQADREAEELIRGLIAATYPNDAILGEEGGETNSTGKSSGYRWILDPIDGTRTFIQGVPLYGTLVGMEQSGEVVLGVIYMPALDECAFAAKGHGAWHQHGVGKPTPARVSTVSHLKDALFCTTDAKGFERIGRKDVYDQLQATCRMGRTWGDCYGYLLVATGRAEMMFDPEMNPWDAAAVQPIIEEAGGTFTDWKGKPTFQGGNAIATNGMLFGEAMRIVGEQRPI